MKSLYTLLLLGLFAIPGVMQAQEFDPEVVYIVVKNDGTRFTGNIVKSDAREILLKTTTIGEIYIPKHEIRSITPFKEGDDQYKEVFATRYFLTTNGLPIEKGDSYVQWHLFGPDLHFGVHDNYSVGVMTTWFASPVVGSFKYTNQLGPKRSYALGVLAGSTLWSSEDWVRLALPYAALTFGDANQNINFSAGYGAVAYPGYRGGQFMMGVGGMKKMTRSGTFVFDSLVFTSSDESVILLIPGFRIQTKEKSAFQFGFPGVYVSGRSSPLGFPVVSWFRKL